MFKRIIKLVDDFQKTRQATSLAKAFYEADPFAPQRVNILEDILRFGTKNPHIKIQGLSSLPERSQSINRDFSSQNPRKFGTTEEDRYRERDMFTGILLDRNPKGIAHQIVHDRCNTLDEKFVYMDMPTSRARKASKQRALDGLYPTPLKLGR